MRAFRVYHLCSILAFMYSIVFKSVLRNNNHSIADMCGKVYCKLHYGAKEFALNWFRAPENSMNPKRWKNDWPSVIGGSIHVSSKHFVCSMFYIHCSEYTCVQTIDENYLVSSSLSTNQQQNACKWTGISFKVQSLKLDQ